MAETLYFTGQVNSALSFTGDGGASQLIATGSVTAAGPQGPPGATGATGATGPAGGVTSVNGNTGVVVLTQDNIASGTTNKAYTATEQTKLAAISGTNTGDETLASIKSKLGVTTLSGSNTGDQDLSSYATTSALTTGLATKANTTHTHAESDVTGLTSDLAAKAAITYVDSQDATKQATLVSGTNIKTVNGTTLLGSGDLVVTGGGNSLNPTAVKTANYTAAANDFVPVDTTSGAITITLPSAPANGTRFGAKIVIQGGTNGVTITRGGTDVFNKTGGNTSVTLSLLNQGVQYQYFSGIWYGVAADIGLTAMDSRYAPITGIPESSITNLTTDLTAKSDFVSPTLTQNYPRSQPVSVDQMETSWTDEYGVGTTSFDTTTFIEGTKSIKVATPTTTALAGMSKTGTFDYSTSNFKLWLKSDNWNNISVARIYFMTDVSNYYVINLNIIFQDMVNTVGTAYNEWYDLFMTRNKFTVTGSPSWSNITKIVVAAASNTGTTANVWFDGLAVYQQAAKGVVSIAFDDGWDTGYNTGMKYMEKYGYTGTAFIIPSLLGTTNYITQANVDDIAKKGWDISGHGITDLTTMTNVNAEADVKATSKYLNGYNYPGANIYAYPNGMNNTAIRGIVGKYFPVARTINYVNSPLAAVNPLRLNALSPTNSWTPALVNAYIDSAAANGEWCVLTFHKIVATPTVSTEFATADFQAVIDHIAATGIEVLPISRVLVKDYSSRAKPITYYRQAGTTRFERWYAAGQAIGTATTTATPTVNTMYAIPFACEKDMTIDQLGIQVTTLATSGQVRIGIYNNTSDTDMYPSSLLIDSGNLDTSTVGMKTAVVSQGLKAGNLYWFVYVAGTTAAQVRSMGVANMYPFFGNTNALATTVGVALSGAFTYAALPFTAPAGMAVFSNSCPVIGFRVSG